MGFKESPNKLFDSFKTTNVFYLDEIEKERKKEKKTERKKTESGNNY